MPNQMPYMPFWVDDFIRGTKQMTDKDIGLYTRFICELWIEGELPHDFKALGKIFGQRESLLCKNFARIAHKFTINESKILHERVTFERNKVLQKLQKNRENGKKGGRPRSEKKPNGLVSVNPNETHVNKNKIKEEDNTPTQVVDIPQSKPELMDIVRIEALCQTIARSYRKGTKPYAVKPFVMNLLGQGVIMDDLEKAVEIDAKNESTSEPEYRHKFENVFKDASVVEDILKTPVEAFSNPVDPDDDGFDPKTCTRDEFIAYTMETPEEYCARAKVKMRENWKK